MEIAGRPGIMVGDGLGYSPDLHPMENVWRVLKWGLKLCLRDPN